MDATGLIALAMAIAIGLSAIGSGIGQGIATGRATESMARQPEMAGGIRTTLILGLAFMETLTIYGLPSLLCCIPSFNEVIRIEARRNHSYKSKEMVL